MPSVSEKMKEVESWVGSSAGAGYQQIGGGVGDDGSSENRTQSDGSSTASERTELEDDNRTNESECETTDARANDENDVFGGLFTEIRDENKNSSISHKRLQKLFLEKYTNYLVWYDWLRKNSTHKKVMSTVKELREGSEGYGREEALKAAVRRRRFLLNDIVDDLKLTHQDKKRRRRRRWRNRARKR